MKEPIRFNTMGFSSTITRAANTTPYTAGDEILSSADAPFVLGTAYTDDSAREYPNNAPLRGRSPEEGRAVVLNSLKLVSSQSTATVLTGQFWFFCEEFSGTDNSEFIPTLAELQDAVIGKVAIDTTFWTQTDNGNILFMPNLDMLMTFPEPSNWEDITGQLWVVLVDGSGYTPASGEVLKLTCNFTRD